jgi:hypothetical protein
VSRAVSVFSRPGVLTRARAESSIARRLSSALLGSGRAVPHGATARAVAGLKADAEARMLTALEMLAPLAPLPRGMRFCDQLDVQTTLEEYVRLCPMCLACVY